MSNARKLLSKCAIETNNWVNKFFNQDDIPNVLVYMEFANAGLDAHRLSIHFLDVCMSDGTSFINCKKELPKVTLKDMYVDNCSRYLTHTFDCVEKLLISDDL